MLEVELNRIAGDRAADRAGYRRLAYLRELRGRDELALGELEPALVNQLLSELLLDVPGAAIGPGNLDAASIGDRDRMVAALYARCFGDRVESQTRCTACQRGFEIGFSLDEEIALIARRAREQEQREPAAGPDGDGFYRLPSGLRFRLPTVADELQLL